MVFDGLLKASQLVAAKTQQLTPLKTLGLQGGYGFTNQRLR
ncbi:hypothetical protein SPLC1_S180140 [Arthrospira platensis C1]|uniref:Uncharacterized protein n=1 Tax=Limnospira maxima CS-328 TaxID=513049 RepID=B5W1Z5_LIMMA|nr:hypothetical protein AmaxDRAFT_2793 [Limnospira maxima CS-328]EKD09541.1 hypothetical protein SPLC1_S180140 [Arthrospira platensis C1]UWU45551.1 hypothetical protein APLC1_0231 [Arthrospira platensis C1]